MTDNRLNSWYYLLKANQWKNSVIASDNAYILWAYNEKSVYAYGSPLDADRYCEYLNADRTTNRYSVAIAESTTKKQLENTINLFDELATIK